VDVAPFVSPINSVKKYKKILFLTPMETGLRRVNEAALAEIRPPSPPLLESGRRRLEQAAAAAAVVSMSPRSGTKEGPPRSIAPSRSPRVREV
jgi:hypothetical protein